MGEGRCPHPILVHSPNWIEPDDPLVEESDTVADRDQGRVMAHAERLMTLKRPPYYSGIQCVAVNLMPSLGMQQLALTLNLGRTLYWRQR